MPEPVLIEQDAHLAADVVRIRRASQRRCHWPLGFNLASCARIAAMIQQLKRQPISLKIFDIGPDLPAAGPFSPQTLLLPLVHGPPDASHLQGLSATKSGVLTNPGKT